MSDSTTDTGSADTQPSSPAEAWADAGAQAVRTALQARVASGDYMGHTTQDDIVAASRALLVYAATSGGPGQAAQTPSPPPSPPPAATDAPPSPTPAPTPPAQC